MKTITCKVPEQLDAEVEAVARDQGVTKSQFMRGALEDQVRRRRGKKAPRAFDLVSDLSGCLEGPADLLTNPKYMDDFGK